MENVERIYRFCLENVNQFVLFYQALQRVFMKSWRLISHLVIWCRYEFYNKREEQF